MGKRFPFETNLAEALAGVKQQTGRLWLARVPQSLGPLVGGALASLSPPPQGLAPDLVIVARDDRRRAEFASSLALTCPGAEVITLPAWDCLPYDRASPSAEVQSLRVAALSALGQKKALSPRILLTTVNALIQRMPTPEFIHHNRLIALPGKVLPMDDLVSWLSRVGYHRASTVREKGDFAVRGGLVDVWPVGKAEPCRLDFFGETLESIRSFDPDSQRSIAQQTELTFLPWGELLLDEPTIASFRKAYTRHFGTPSPSDTFYQSVRDGRRMPGIEHWLPCFHETSASLFSFCEGAVFLLDHQVEEALAEQDRTIRDYYNARLEQQTRDRDKALYKPLPVESLYLSAAEIETAFASQSVLALYAYLPDERKGERVIDTHGRIGHSFTAERAQGHNVFDDVVSFIAERQSKKQRVLLTGWSEGSRERMAGLLIDHGLSQPVMIESLAEALAYPRNQTLMAVLGLEQGGELDDLVVITEQDILGERALAGRSRKRKASEALTEAASLTIGDYVVHIDHGIGQFVGLKVITALGMPHECLELTYAGGDRFFLPVENIELLSRYADQESLVTLDRLGSASWQARKARVKQRVRDMAAKLIEVAATRMLRHGIRVAPPEGLYDEFVSRFPFGETEDQLSAIDAVLDDLSSGRPMDRLVCGDVGFGKTEVGLRAAFVMAMSGRQVAVVTPTTLLCRQHYATFVERFRGLPLTIRQLSRFSTTAERKETLSGLAEGKVDIVIGTHAVLAKTIKFRDLALLIIDEEQHFGVAHKERLKQLRADIHVLTLTATPIPRTLQLALTGVRDLSLIATPPIDRLAVRTFIAPFDELSVREALLREHYRNGQSFFVCPRISDLDRLQTFLRESVPEVRVGMANGQMAAEELEEVVSAFYEGQYDVLLSTNIVESGLDVPNANTLIVYRADKFGLAQLYQLRGRVGRSKVRAYSLFTTPANHQPTPQATKRLEVLQSLDTLGAGFQLASYDLDLRGSGNLLGEEQSGHIKEVGFELYQHMLEEAVAELRARPDATDDQPANEAWSPALTLGISVIIPDYYISDHTVRMSIYRDLAALTDQTDIEGYAAGLRDRFGPLPNEVENLLKVIIIKSYCRKANIERIDVGPQGILIGFRDNSFAEPLALLKLIERDRGGAKARADHKVFFKRDLRRESERAGEVFKLAMALVRLIDKDVS